MTGFGREDTNNMRVNCMVILIDITTEGGSNNLIKKVGLDMNFGVVGCGDYCGIEPILQLNTYPIPRILSLLSSVLCSLGLYLRHHWRDNSRAYNLLCTSTPHVHAEYSWLIPIPLTAVADSS